MFKKQLFSFDTIFDTIFYCTLISVYRNLKNGSIYIYLLRKQIYTVNNK